MPRTKDEHLCLLRYLTPVWRRDAVRFLSHVYQHKPEQLTLSKAKLWVGQSRHSGSTAGWGMNYVYLFQTGFEVHPDAYITGAEGSLPGSKAARA
jgi:hypothetical protein